MRELEQLKEEIWEKCIEALRESQLGLATLVEELAKCNIESNLEIKRLYGNDKERRLATASMGSYRGHYYELHIGYEVTESDAKIKDIIKEASDYLAGKKYNGYKGGTYTATSGTPVWIAEDYGDRYGDIIIAVTNHVEKPTLLVCPEEFPAKAWEHFGLAGVECDREY